MAMGSYRLSTEVARPAHAPSTARLAVQTPHLAEGRPFAGAEAAADAYIRLGKTIEAKRERDAQEAATEAAQKAQTELSEKSLGLYDRQEKAASGVVREWDEKCKAKLREVGATLDPDARKAFEQRMAPWIFGRRDNLMVHERREVRRGRVNAIENGMNSQAVSETNEIMANLAAQERAWEADSAKVTPEQRKAFYNERMAQAMIVNTQFDERYASAVKDGLYGEEEARTRWTKHRHDAAKTLLDASINAGNADFAEYVLDRLDEAEKGAEGAKPPEKGAQGAKPPEKGDKGAEQSNKGSLATACGLSADELSGYRSAVQRVRDRNDAAIERKAAEAQRRAVELDQSEIIEHTLSAKPPETQEEAAANLKEEAAFYEDRATNAELPKSVRLSHARTARRLKEEEHALRASMGQAKGGGKTGQDRATREAQKENYDIIKTLLDSGVRLNKSGEDVGDFTPEEAVKVINERFNEGGLNADQRTVLLADAYTKIRAGNVKKLSKGAELLKQRIFRGVAAQFPAMVKWQEDSLSFAIPDTKEGWEMRDTKVKVPVDEKGNTERRIFRQVVAAANWAIANMDKEGMNVDKAYEVYCRAVSGAESELAKLSYERLEDLRRGVREAWGRRAKTPIIQIKEVKEER